MACWGSTDVTWRCGDAVYEYIKQKKYFKRKYYMLKHLWKKMKLHIYTIYIYYVTTFLFHWNLLFFYYIIILYFLWCCWQYSFKYMCTNAFNLSTLTKFIYRISSSFLTLHNLHYVVAYSAEIFIIDPLNYIYYSSTVDCFMCGG